MMFSHALMILRRGSSLIVVVDVVVGGDATFLCQDF